MTDHIPPEKQSCRELLDDLQAFVDGELEPERVARLRQHAEECPPCFDVAEFQEAVKRLTGHCCREAAPEDLRARVVALLAEDQPG